MKGIRIFASRLGLFSIISLVLVALGGTVLADAQTPSPKPTPTAEHLLLVPDEAAVAQTDARVLARYDSFALVEAAGGDEQRLRAAGAQRRDDMREVVTAAGALDPVTDRASLAGKQAPDRDEVLALVQFIGPPKDAWLERLRATGARIVTYQAENAYVVHASGDAVERLAGLVGADPAVRAVVPLGVADKVEGPADAPGRYAVSTVAGPAGADARDAAADAGSPVSGASTVGELRTQYLELTAADVAELAGDPAVVAIEPDPLPTPNDERTAQIVAGNLAPPAFTAPSGPGYLPWHDAQFPGGYDVTIDVTDTGLDDGTLAPEHPDFHELGSGASPGRVVYQADYTSPPPGGVDLDTDARDCSGHGTNVASIAAGYNDGTGPQNQDTGGFNHGLGVAPLAQIGVSKVFQGCSTYDGPDLGSAPDHAFAPDTSISAIASNAYDGGARISNNSWGAGGATGWGEYTARTREFDGLVRDAQSGTPGNQELVEVLSAGNDGAVGTATIHTEGSAKNVITVGASESVRATGEDGCGTVDASADNARQVAGFSSRGPTDDGRLKPDLVAPGTHVTGARPLDDSSYNGSGTCNPVFAGTLGYSLVSGSSQAAPQVSGAAALVRAWYEDNEGVPPSPALTKALLINAASDLGGGPGNDQGFGRVDLGAVFDSTARELYDQQPVDLLDDVGATVVRAYDVQATSQPVRVTLVWTDPPGSVVGNAFVNDLDLEVAEAGETYRGNVFAGSLSRPGGAADHRNNVESVVLPAGTAGRFSVTVRATTLAQDGRPGLGDLTDQDFALVVSNAVEQPAPVLVHDATTIDGGDGDGVLESDEQVEVSEQVRNAGNADATGFSATLTGPSTLAIAQGTSAYPTVPEDDGVAENTTSFGVRLANAASCGQDVPTTLTMTAGAETQAIPVVMPTGATAAAAQTAASGAQRAIPDNSATGVSTSVFVGERGRIKDLDVAVGWIDHPWVGDLVIDVTGPDGTTVRLADRPGGPDNSGDDMVGTVFDDEAGPRIGDVGTSAPYTGSFRPQNDQLSRFDGKSRRGTWTLTVRDLFSKDQGTLQGWSVASRKAVCNVDTSPPDTQITAGPADPTTSTLASFSFASNDAGASFECRLDGAAYGPCPGSASFSGLAVGAHTVNARAIDGSDNEDPTPASYAWTINASPGDPPVTPATSFVLAPVEERTAEALAGRYRVIAACATACRAGARLTVSARTARRLGLGRRSVELGSGAKRRASAGTATVGVRLTRRAKAALRRQPATSARLRVTLTEGNAKLTVERNITLRRGAGLRRIASRGLKLWAACARRCPLSGKLSLSAAEARRLGLEPGRARRLEVAAGSTTSTRTPRVLTLRVRRSAHRAFQRARRVGALLEAVAGTAPDPLRTARLAKTLRR